MWGRAIECGVLENPWSAAPEAPFTLEADVANTSATELCALVPGVERIGSRTVRFDTDDFRTLYRCLLTWTHVGASEAPRYPGP